MRPVFDSPDLVGFDSVLKIYVHSATETRKRDLKFIAQIRLAQRADPTMKGRGDSDLTRVSDFSFARRLPEPLSRRNRENLSQRWDVGIVLYISWCRRGIDTEKPEIVNNN